MKHTKPRSRAKPSPATSRHPSPSSVLTTTASLPATEKQRGGITGKGFLPGVSGNPSGRGPGEKGLLVKMYGVDGLKVFERLERMRMDPKTSRKLQVQIDFFLIERMFGRAQQHVEVAPGGTLVDLLAQVTVRRT